MHDARRTYKKSWQPLRHESDGICRGGHDLQQLSERHKARQVRALDGAEQQHVQELVQSRPLVSVAEGLSIAVTQHKQGAQLARARAHCLQHKLRQALQRALCWSRFAIRVMHR